MTTEEPKVPELRFLRNDAGEGEGLSDAGIETYRADPFPAVARETSQNSRDAHDKERHADAPVRVEIERITIPGASLPGYDKYKEVAKRCLDLAIKQNRRKETAFFQQAQRVLSQDQIPVLRVADFNTTGLTGPCEEGTPFHSLVKSSGVSRKEDDTSSGSFGIGKSAVYSASDLQTVFYSTSYLDGAGQRVFLCQGKTKFMSFTDAAGQAFRSVGYWGDPVGYLPIQLPSLAPEWLQRDETGTTVCSIAVRDSDDWQNEIMASLLMNFFSAIHKNEMEFKVQGELLNSRTLRLRLDDPAIAAAAKTKQEDYAFAQHMHDCLTNDDEATTYSLEVPDAGTFCLRLMVKDGLPKRVGILRNGMYICDSLAHFGDKFARFSMYRDFVAIVEPTNDHANSWLRRMENPRHDEFSPERLLTSADRRSAAVAGQKLAKMIRERIKEAAKPQTNDETDLEELSEFFALDNKGRKDDTGTRDVESFKVLKNPSTLRSRQTKTPASRSHGSAGGGATQHGEGTRKNGGEGPGKGAGTGGTGTHSSKKPFVLNEPRTLVPDSQDFSRRRILFTPAESGEAFLKFESSGLSDTQDLPTLPAECRVQCVAGERQQIDVCFETPYDGPIEIVSWSAVEADGEA